MAGNDYTNLRRVAEKVMDGAWTPDGGGEVKLIAALIVDLLDQGTDSSKNAARRLVFKLTELPENKISS